MDERRIAVEIALQAGEILRQEWMKEGQPVSLKGNVINPVTDVDRRSEAWIKQELRAAFPKDGILAEESGESITGLSRRWIIDPLDGTTNFIRRYPLVAVSIGLEIDGQLVLGVVNNPISGELFLAEKGDGATLNGRSIHVSDTADLGSSLLASGFPYDAWNNPDNNSREWSRFLRSTRSLRCDGSAALDLCQVACGRLDGYWEKGLSAWDLAAGLVIAEEAGAVVSDYVLGTHCLNRGEVVAANSRLHPLMIQLIHQVG